MSSQLGNPLSGINREFKPKVQSEAMCRHCKNLSGWKNEDFVALKDIREKMNIRCQSCNKDFMTILPISSASNVLADLILSRSVPKAAEL